MYAIIGTIKEYTGGFNEPLLYTDREKVIATFDNYDDAQEYLEKSKLKQPKPFYPFKTRSLLCSCVKASIEKYQPEDPISHNPKLD